MLMPPWEDFWNGRHVVVLGGAGFLGSHLVELLEQLGARVLVVDALVPGSGGTVANLPASVDFLHANAGEVERWLPFLQPEGVILHCAAFNTHRWCNEHPEEDARWNYLPNCRIAQALQGFPQRLHLLYVSTRTVYAPTHRRWITEEHPTAPADVYSLHCLASERLFALTVPSRHRLLCVRLPHLYGPRQALHRLEPGFLGELLRAALFDRPYTLYAHGMVRRDVLAVHDAAEALLRLLASGAQGTFHVPGVYVSALELARTLSKLTGWQQYTLSELPAASLPRLSGKRLQRALNWLPRTPLEEGLARTVAALRIAYSAPLS